MVLAQNMLHGLGEFGVWRSFRGGRNRSRSRSIGPVQIEHFTLAGIVQGAYGAGGGFAMNRLKKFMRIGLRQHNVRDDEIRFAAVMRVKSGLTIAWKRQG